MTPQDRVARVVHFFVLQARKPLGRTQLVKLVYLADLEARRYLGHPVTDIAWRFHHHGPFDERVGVAVRSLRTAGVVRAETVEYPTTLSKDYKPASLDEPDLSDLSPGQRRVLELVAARWANANLRAVLRAAYATKPMQGVARGQTLNMQQVDGEAKDEGLGLSLEDIARGEEDLRAGRVVSGEDFKRGVEARLHRHGG